MKSIVKAITEDKEFNLIRQTIIETIQEVLRDPDFGLDLQDWAKRRLRKTPRRLVPFDKVKKKHAF